MSKSHHANLNNSTEFFLIAISLLENDSKTNIMPELMQVFTPKQIIILSQIFGGKSIKIPSTKELSLSLKAALYIYQTTFLKKDYADIFKELQVTEFELELIKEKAESWYACLNEKAGVEYYKAIRG